VKLLIVVPWGERLGGAESMLWGFLRRFNRRELEARVVFLRTGPFQGEVSALGIPTLVLPASRLRDLGNARRTVFSLAHVLRLERPDLILNWMPKTQLYGAVAAMLADMANRVIWWQHGMTQGHWIDRLATLLPARAVGCSSSASATAQASLWPRRRTFVVYPGIEVPQSAPTSERRALRCRLAIPPQRTVIGIVGRLQPSKGQDRLLRAVWELRQRQHNVHGLFVGGNAHNLSPGYERSLHRLADELGVSDAVTFTGQVPDADQHIGAMDVLVSLSDSESFGLTLVEAMARCVPVLTFGGDGRDEVIDHEAGVLVSHRDQQSLVEALERLVTNPGRRRQLASNGRARYEACFRLDEMTEKLTSALHRAVVDSPAPDLAAEATQPK
jgi:glycosyltransferase involved in cell wall biosynthesis